MMARRDPISPMRRDCGSAGRLRVMERGTRSEGLGAAVRDGVMARQLPPAKGTVGDRPPSIVGRLVA
jgi:hypothetical protein